LEEFLADLDRLSPGRIGRQEENLHLGHGMASRCARTHTVTCTRVIAPERMAGLKYAIRASEFILARRRTVKTSPRQIGSTGSSWAYRRGRGEIQFWIYPSRLTQRDPPRREASPGWSKASKELGWESNHKGHNDHQDMDKLAEGIGPSQIWLVLRDLRDLGGSARFSESDQPIELVPGGVQRERVVCTFRSTALGPHPLPTSVSM
jgi:hypothetical protein